MKRYGLTASGKRIHRVYIARVALTVCQSHHVVSVMHAESADKTWPGLPVCKRCEP